MTTAANEIQLKDQPVFTGDTGEVACDMCAESKKLIAVKSCLFCLRSFCEHHLNKHQQTPVFKSHKLIKPTARLSDRACGEHGRPLELYCRRDKRCICSLCVETSGDVVPVETERHRRQAEQKRDIEELTKMINRKKEKQEDFKESVNNAQETLEQQQKVIEEVFTAIKNLVRRSEEKLQAPLQNGQNSLRTEMKEKTQQIQEEVKMIEELILSFHQINQEDDVLFIQNYPRLPDSLQNGCTASIDTDLKFGPTTNIKISLLAGINAEMEKLCPVDLRRVKKFLVDETLDTETAHPGLQVSPDRKAVSYRGGTPQKPCSPKQFDQVCGVLGERGITSGRAYWEVDVGNNGGWEVGVVREASRRQGKLSFKPSEGYWVIALYGREVYAAFEEPPVHFGPSIKPRNLGVFVDYEEALVSFYDLKTKRHVYTFSECDFKGEIRPYFNPHMNAEGINLCSLQESVGTEGMKIEL